MGNSVPYDLLVGVGTLYIAPANTAMPALGTTPSGTWRALGETHDGVKVAKTQNIETFTSDQRTGKVKAVRTEESLTVETALQSQTLENLADVINGTVTTVPPGASTIGTKSLSMYKGADVQEFAFLFVGNSPYGNWPAQYYVPRGIFNGDVELEYKKEDKTVIPVTFEAMEDLTAVSAADRFGQYIAQHAAATG
jgi:hypothetical protein